MKKIMWFVIASLMIACNNKKSEYKEKETTEDSLSVAQFNPSEAKELMEKHCYLCHNPTAAEQEGRIAPPMVAIKARYIDMQGYTKEEFIKAISEFVSNPTEEKALMNGAVRKFNVMPKQVFLKVALLK